LEGDVSMKCAKLMCITAITLFALLVIPAQIAAQKQAKARPHYRFVELGTLGGPNSAFTGQAYVLKNSGGGTGYSDTSTPDPNYPNFNPLLGKNPFIQHAFRWKGHFPIADMGAFPGTNSAFTNALNTKGAAVGMSENGSIDPVTGWPEVTAALWEPGRKTPKNLGTLPGGYESFAILINDSGFVAGISENAVADPYSMFGFPTQTRAVVWENGNIMDIGTLGGPDASPSSSTLNNRGQVAGYSYTNGTPNSVTTPCGTNIPTEDPFFWDGTQMWDVGTLGGTCGLPNALNNEGQVVGQSDLKGDVFYHPFLWKKGMNEPQDLGTLGGNYGGANWENDAGEVVGWANLPGDQVNHALLWKKGKKMKDLGVLKGDKCDIAWGINSKAQIIGDSGDCSSNVPRRSFFWENGSIYDLSSVFPPGHFQWSDAVFINDSGEIAGNGVLQNGDARAFLLIPCEAGAKGCKGLTPGEAAYSPAISQNPTTMTEASPSTTWRMGVMRGRLGVRYPHGVPQSGSGGKPEAAYITDEMPFKLSGHCALNLIFYNGECVGPRRGVCTIHWDPTHCPPGKRGKGLDHACLNQYFHHFDPTSRCSVR
jgi:probable HAF family extracellular repeat protein